jgi:HSP20 family molecular chaperone IbpA
MTTLQLNERVFPTDLLFRNFFDTNSMFQSYVEQKPNYPVDIYTLDNELCFDIACVGLDKKDIDILTEGNTLKVSYKKPSVESNPSDIEAEDYIHKGITRKSFDMGWKISAKYNLSGIVAGMKNGLLTIKIPVSKESLPKSVIIK